MIRTSIRAWVCLSAFILLPEIGHSQFPCAPAVTLAGAGAGEEAGHAVAIVGDLNRDGFDDYAVGAPYYSLGGGQDSIGIVRVYSGINASILYTIVSGGTAHQNFGWSIAAAGDVNRDGYEDFMASAPGYTSNIGRVMIYSGLDGTVIRTLNGALFGDWFGWSVAGVGDVNHDGYPDQIVGAPQLTRPADSGYCKVYSGFDGSVLRARSGFAPGSHFGWAVGGGGDINNDGYRDYIVGAPEVFGAVDTSGRAYTFSGFDGSFMRAFGSAFDNFNNNRYGYAVDIIGDANGDGYDDIIVGDPLGGDFGGADRGYAEVLSGLNGSTLSWVAGASTGVRLGAAVGGAGDLDLDGIADFWVGTPGWDSFGCGGRVDVISTATQTSLYIIQCQTATGDQLGFSASADGDINADGFKDIIVGAPLNDQVAPDAGRSFVWYLGDYDDDGTDDYCDLCTDRDGDGYGDPGFPSNSCPNDNCPSVYNPSQADGNGDGVGDGCEVKNTTLTVYAGTSATQVAAPGDLNSDGHCDIVAGDAGADVSAIDAGRVEVYSGSNGAQLYSIDGESAGDAFGYAMSEAGDLNTDAVKDFLVGGFSAGGTGRAYVRSGIDGSEIFTLIGPTPGGLFGTALADGGLIDGDLIPDVIVGDWGGDTVYAYSGSDFSLIHKWSGANIGYSVSGIGDLNDDARADVACTQQAVESGAGRVYIFSGLDADTVFHFTGLSAGEGLGFFVASSGDLNRDGYNDVLVSSSLGGTERGKAYLLSGKNGVALRTHEGDADFVSLGYSLSSLDDIDSDGFADYAVSSPYYDIPTGTSDNRGRIDVHSGKSGSVIFRMTGSGPNDILGYNLSSGDVNGDGKNDLVAGGSQRFDVFSFGDPDIDAIPDAVDNCPTVANPGQEDADSNGIGDACDSALDTLEVTVYSPVDIIVITPDGQDSIGMDGAGGSFNTIGPTATYDNVTDWGVGPNGVVGESDDRVTILDPLKGEYTIKVVSETNAVPEDEYYIGVVWGVRDPGGNRRDGYVSMDGANAPYVSDTPVANPVPLPGTADTVGVAVSPQRRGDMDGNGVYDVVDAIGVIGVAFRGMAPPDPPFIADVNSDGITSDVVDVVRIVGTVFRGQPEPGP